MTMGPQAKKIVDAAKERGLPVPSSCYPPIVLTDRLARFFDAFWELSSSRQIHMAGAGPIPWNVMDLYAARHDLVGRDEEYEDFTFIVRSLDDEFLAIQGDDVKKRAAEAEAKAKRKGGRGR